METPLEQAKRIIGGMGDMYESMASTLGNRVKCDTCGKEKSVKSAECLQFGWPQCCGYTMTLLSPNRR